MSQPMDCRPDEYIPKDKTNIRQFDEFKNRNWKVGDLVWCTTGYRDTETRIIGINGILIKNPDKSGNGRLTIPNEITKHLEDPKKFYLSCKYDIDIIEMEMKI